MEECEEILTSLLEKDLSSSIFNKMISLKNLQLLRGVRNTYNRLIAIFLHSITVFWQHGEITNFEYLMFLNSCAGRSFLDLTQYPVFPWILNDYRSEELDLENPAIYRDLSKPMGALGAKRASQYYERYQTMNDFYNEGMFLLSIQSTALIWSCSFHFFFCRVSVSISVLSCFFSSVFILLFVSL
jgi:hypothetical protein